MVRCSRPRAHHNTIFLIIFASAIVAVAISNRFRPFREVDGVHDTLAGAVAAIRCAQQISIFIVIPLDY